MGDIVVWLAENAIRMGEDRFPQIKSYHAIDKQGITAVTTLMQPINTPPPFRHCSNND